MEALETSSMTDSGSPLRRRVRSSAPWAEHCLVVFGAGILIVAADQAGVFVPAVRIRAGWGRVVPFETDMTGAPLRLSFLVWQCEGWLV